MIKLKSYDKKLVGECLNIAWPAILESFFSAFAGLVDSYMVSSLGSSAVAAVGLTTQPKFMGLAVFFAINIAVSALVARRKGERRQLEADRVLSSAVILVFFASIAVSALLVGLADPIIHFCGSTEETHDSAVTYYKVIMAGMIFNTMSMVINSAQRGCGNTRITMTTNVTSNIVNIIFNYLLIGGHLGFPALGIWGAAFATVLGTVVACVMSILSVCRKDNFINFQTIFREKLFPRVETYVSIVHVGYGIFFEQILMRVGFMLTALMAADQGTYAMAAHQVGMNLLGLSFSFGDGLQATAVALIGFALGAEDPDLAKEYGRTCRMLGFCCAGFLAMVYLFGSRALFSLFFEEAEIVQIGVNISYVIIPVLFFQITQVIVMGCLRGAGDTTYTAMASAISVTVVRTICSYVGGYILGFGIIGIWSGVLGDQLSRFIFATLRFRKGKWVDIKI